MSSFHIHFAHFCHSSQKRRDGNPYITHPLNVMSMVKSLSLPKEAEIAAVLHDVCENCPVSPECIEKYFGKEVSFLVHGLTKKPKSDFSNSYQRVLEYTKRLEQCSRMNPFILFVKICDQIDNLKTISVFPKKKQSEVRNEIKNIYIPLYKKKKTNIPQQYRFSYTKILTELESMVSISPSPQKIGKKILIIEPENRLKNLYELAFRSHHFEVQTAQNTEEAIEEIQRQLPHIILTELLIPEIQDGFSFLETIQKKNITNIIAVNSNATENFSLAKTLGATLCLQKGKHTPFEIVAEIMVYFGESLKFSCLS